MDTMLEGWTDTEQAVAREAFDRAYTRAVQQLVAQVRAKADELEDAETVWQLHDYLSIERHTIEGRFDFRLDGILFVFASLVKEGLLQLDELQGLDAPYDLVHVPPHARGVVEAEHELVLGIDDEHRADSERQLLLVEISRIDHAVGHGDGSVLVADDRKLDLDLVLAVGHDVLEPLLVALDGIDRQRGDEASHLGELVVLQGESADLGRADGGEVRWMAEEDGPLALLPLVEGVELALGRVHGEVGDDVTEAQAAVGGFLGVQAHVGLGSGLDGGTHHDHV